MNKVLDFFKKQSIAFYVLIAAVIFTLIALIIYLNNSKGAYYDDTNALIVTFSIFAMIFIIALAVLPNFVGDKNYLSLLLVGAAVFLAVAVVTYLQSRTTLMGYLWFSDLEANNPIAVTAMNQTVTSWVFYGLAIAAVIACGFMKLKKTEV